MDKTVAVSVVIPVYNCRDYIEKIADMVKKQSFTDWELIIVNDGSTDGVEEICNKIVASDERICAIHGKNEGAAAARNKGAANANGKYIAFIDADDEISEDYLKTLYELAEAFGAEVAVSGYENVYEEGSGFDKAKKIKNSVNTETDSYEIGSFSGVYAMEQLLYQTKFISVPWGCIIRKDLFVGFTFPEGRLVEDFATMYKIYGNAKKVVYTDEPLYRYYQRKSSTIYNEGNAYRKNREYYSHSIDMLRYLKNNFPKSVNAGYSRHFSTCFQILSEVDYSEKTAPFINQVYGDIRKLQNKVIFMRRARLFNKGAAVLSLVDVRIMHFILRIYYKLRIKGL